MNDIKNYSEYEIEAPEFSDRQNTEEPLGFFDYYLDSVWFYGFNFSAPMPRARFWISMIIVNLIFVIVLLSLSVIFSVKELSTIQTILLGIFLIFYFVKLIEVQVRRLKDANKSGWFVILSFIPILDILPLILYFFPGSECLKTAWTKNDTKILVVYLIIVLGLLSLCLIL